MATFKNINQIPVSPARAVCISAVVEDDGHVTGYNINSYIQTGKYTGYTKAIFIPAEHFGAFQEMIANVELATNEIEP